MKALSLRQPWPWAILTLGKDIENRTWKTNFRGRAMLHASKKYDHEGAAWIRDTFAFSTGEGIVLKSSPDAEMDIIVPGPDDLPRGGHVGSVEIIDCVDCSNSEWFFGSFGYVLRNPIEVSYMAAKGKLGFFNVGEETRKAYEDLVSTEEYNVRVRGKFVENDR